jgi:glycosyltransferase involved in cell wall biosynthesis
MAHIFKHPNKSNKGIIIFTHKELQIFNLKVNRRLIKNPIRILTTYFLFKRKISCIREKYFIGIHYGAHHRNLKTPAWVDFHMSAPGTAKFLDNPNIFPLNSANFTPLVMQKDSDTTKYWDIICVAHSTYQKKYPELLKAIRKLFDLDNNLKILFVIASGKDESDRKKYYKTIFEDYNKMFSQKERELFTIIKTHPETGFQGFSYTFLSYLYNRSKVFTIFSQIEGESRVVKEAQLCGLPVVVKSDVQGGMRDYLNESNSLFFNNYEDAHITLKEAIDNYDKFEINTDYWVKELREDYSLKKLKDYLFEFYNSKGIIFDGELINTDNLNRRLPAHYYDIESVPWASNSEFRFKTTDIFNVYMLRSFFKELKL